MCVVRWVADACMGLCQCIFLYFFCVCVCVPVPVSIYLDGMCVHAFMHLRVHVREKVYMYTGTGIASDGSDGQ